MLWEKPGRAEYNHDLKPSFLLSTIALAVVSCGPRRAASNLPTVIVLGIDGMDPGFVKRYWHELPNLRELRDRGSFQRLGTTTPPQSPVAWSTFITGLDPARHGIFDFVHRDAGTLRPYSSITRTEEPRFQLTLGSYVLPLSRPRVTSLRQGTPFWQLLDERNVPVTTVRVPTNYPPVEAGHALAGMGTPDLRGTLGTFTFFTDDPIELTRSVSGGQVMKVELADGHALLELEGPPNPLRKDQHVASTRLDVDVDAEERVIRVATSGDAAVIREGEWSGWLSAYFPLLGRAASARGIFRVFAKQLHPRFELYVSPINIDPLDPALRVSAPAEWAGDVAQRIGRYSTLGIPEDTAVYREGYFDRQQFRSQTRLVMEEERRLLQDALAHRTNGFLFFYFSSVDQSSHMLWGRFEPELLEVYREADARVGEVLVAARDATVIILSDHGFTSFDRAVHLNTWLSHHGFLAAEPGANANLASADWLRTVAYALGLNGLYVNLKGREKKGVVERGQPREALVARLREELLAWRDPDTGSAVVEGVSESKAIADNAAAAPDLLIGYAPRYRGSWQTALGGLPVPEIEPNQDAWIADHCIVADRVPGVLISSRPSKLADPQIADVTVSVLHLFGVAAPAGSSGRSLF